MVVVLAFSEVVMDVKGSDADLSDTGWGVCCRVDKTDETGSICRRLMRLMQRCMICRSGRSERTWVKHRGARTRQHSKARVVMTPFPTSPATRELPLSPLSTIFPTRVGP